MTKNNWMSWLQDEGYVFLEKNQLETVWQKSMAPSCITVLSHEEILTISGRDAVKFLQGQATCDVQNLAISEAVLGACCTPKGRMIANFRVTKLSDELLRLTLPAGQANVLMQSLSKYAAFYKISLQVDSGWVRIGVISNVLSEMSTSILDDLLTLKLSDSRLELWVPEDKSIDFLKKLSAIYPIAPTNYWQLKDIECGIVWITPDTTESLLPQEGNLDKIGAINFKKGCYTGQEIIARLHYKGKAKSRINYFITETETELLSATTLVYNFTNKSIGQVVNYAISPLDNRAHVLANVRLDQLGQPLHFEQDNVKLLLQSLPYCVEDEKGE